MNRQKLVSQIRRYVPYNEQEEADKALILNWIEKNDDAFLRDNVVAHMTASAWVVDKDRSKVLMVYHNIYHSWSWLGGHADGETDLLAVAIREVKEEAGISDVRPVSEEIPGELAYIDIIVNVMNLIFEEEGNSEILEKYVKDILYENYSDEILMEERGRLFGMDVEHDWFSAVVINFRKRYVPDEQDWKGIRFLGRTLLERMRETAGIRECVMVPLEKGYLILTEGEDECKLRETLVDFFEEERICSLWNAGTDKFVCSVGPVRTGLAGIRDTYSDAFKAIRVMRKLQPENCVCVYEKVEMYCVLQDLFSAGKRDVFERILAPVESREFLETLWTYFMCSGSLDETAGVLHTHRNTVKYRLGRIQAVTGLDIKRPEDGFKLYMGVLAWRMKE